MLTSVESPTRKFKQRSDSEEHYTQMKRFFSLLVTTGLLVAGAQAAIVFDREAAGQQSTTISDPVTVETFDGLLVGTSLDGYGSSIGTYSGVGIVVGQNAYGGAGQTNYASVGAQTGASGFYEINFGAAISYFGIYWGAGDGQNVVQFYNGADLKGTFNTAAIAAGLSAAYYGNPINGANTSEPYVFVNFRAETGADAFDRVRVINNSAGTGFETDNHTILAQPPTVPEPATFALAGFSLLALGLKLRKR